MALLYDDVLSRRLNLVAPSSISSHPEAIAAFQSITKMLLYNLSRSQVFRIDNVSRYFYESCCHQWDLTTSFPNLAPVFDSMWFEYDPPSYILEIADPKSLDYESPKVLRDVRGKFGRSGIYIQGKKTSTGFDLLTITLTQISKNDAGTVGLFMAKFKLSPLGVVEDVVPMLYPGTNDLKHGSEAWHEHTTGALLAVPAFLALSFLHYKNVSVLDERPPVPLNKKFQKKTGRQLTQFKVLEIEPMKQVLKHEGEAESTGLKKALHICRGHFKDYRESGLGKNHVKGLWWWGDHVRGHLEEGVVNKEYDVKEPRHEAKGHPDPQPV